MRARAIVMPLPPRTGAIAVRQDARDRARRAPVPRDHPVRARDGARARTATDGAYDPRQAAVAWPRARRRRICIVPAPRRGPPVGARDVLVGRHARHRRRCSCVAGRRRRRARRRAGRRLSSAAGAERLRAPSGARLGGPPHARLAGAVRDHLHVARGGDLLLARRRRRPRARADAARLPVRRRVLRARGDDLRRGRVAAPGPRRARRSSRATPSTSCGASSPAGRCCSTT